MVTSLFSVILFSFLCKPVSHHTRKTWSHILVFWIKPFKGLSYLPVKSSLNCGTQKLSMTYLMPLYSRPTTYTSLFTRLCLCFSCSFYLDLFPQGRPGEHLILFEDSALLSPHLKSLHSLSSCSESILHSCVSPGTLYTSMNSNYNTWVLISLFS